jgi:hypothetical protein
MSLEIRLSLSAFSREEKKLLNNEPNISPPADTKSVVAEAEFSGSAKRAPPTIRKIAFSLEFHKFCELAATRFSPFCMNLQILVFPRSLGGRSFPLKATLMFGCTKSSGLW